MYFLEGFRNQKWVRLECHACKEWAMDRVWDAPRAYQLCQCRVVDRHGNVVCQLNQFC
jgi:hypothetical protein